MGGFEGWRVEEIRSIKVGVYGQGVGLRASGLQVLGVQGLELGLRNCFSGLRV